MKKIPINHKSEGSVYLGKHKYLQGNDVPIFEVTNVHSFNKMVGFLKFLNNKEYNVLLGLLDNISLDGVDVILNRKLLEE